MSCDKHTHTMVMNRQLDCYTCLYCPMLLPLEEFNSFKWYGARNSKPDTLASVVTGPISDPEIDELFKGLQQDLGAIPDWMILPSPGQGTIVAPKCDCGAIKANTTHADYCSTKQGAK